MKCQSFREACSARLDSEETGLEATALDAHRAFCQWLLAADRLTRQTPIVAAPQVPELTAEILARAPQSRFRETVGGRRPPNVPRFAISRAHRANGMPPLVAALVGGLTLTSRLDILNGRTAAGTEAPHGLAILGLMLLWWVAHPTTGPRPRHA